MAKPNGEKYRIGVIGCGSTSGHFFQGWGAWPDEAEVVAMCDVAPSQMKRAKEAYAQVCGQADEYADYHEMLEKARLDIVSICSFSDKHLQHTEDCLSTGCHVFVEKPVGYDLEEARRFKYLARKHCHLKVQVAYSLRFYKAFMDLRALIRSGALGDIVSGEISYCHGHPAPGQQRRPDEASAGAAAEETPAQEPQREPPSGRNPYEDAGGNYKRSSQCTHATHPWDLARYLLGEVREVFATTGPCNMGILWMHSGAICHVLAGTVRQASVGYMQRQIVAVHGRLGCGWLNREETPPYRWLATYKTDDDIQPCPQVSDLPESSHGVTIRTKNLLDAIEGKAELICSLEDGATTSEMLHALWLSQRLQVKVPVLPAGHTG